MNLFSSSFTFYKAGQGAFYGGVIRELHGDNYYSMVYDCGTSPFITGHAKTLNSEISSFKSTLVSLSKDDRPKIDFLFISHLDYDHVCGIKRLLREFNVIKIILPYIDPLLRVLFFDTYEEGDYEGLLSQEDYGRLLINPVEFFKSFEGQTTIYFVKAEERNNNDFTAGEIYEVGSPSFIDEFIDETNVKVFKNNLELRIRRKWDFITHVKEVENSVIQYIKSDILDILKLKDNANLSTNDLSQLFKLDDNRKKLRECYKRHLNDINAHGLVLLHGPKNFDRICVGNSICPCKYNYCYCSYCNNVKLNGASLYTLLLGDTSLNLNNYPLKFPEPLIEKFKYVHVIQIPHHGSSKNWNQQQYKLLELGKSLKNSLELTSVCNYGVGNTYNHPSYDILNEVDNKLVLNNQYTRYTTSYCFIKFND